MITEMIQFLEELQKNNNRDWFQDNKKKYEVLRKEYIENIQTLIHNISLFDPEVAGLEAKDTLFRIYRDIRFSPNKQPYKNHMGAYIAQGGRNSVRNGYYLHIEPGNCLLSGGLWRPEPALLKMVRKEIFDQMEEFVAIIEDADFKATYGEMEGEKLKRMPAGYPSDFPHSEYLLHKDFCFSAHIPDHFFANENWIEEATEIFKKLYPFNQFLNYTVDEFQGRI